MPSCSWIKTQWKKTSFLLLSSSLFLCNFASANSMVMPSDNVFNSVASFSDMNWNFFLSASAGVASTKSVMSRQYFPATSLTNPATNQNYLYTPGEAAQTKYLGDVAMGFEGRFTSVWLLQVGLNYNQTARFVAQGDLQQGLPVLKPLTADYRYYVLARQLLVSGKLLGTVNDIFHPYLFGGAGLAVNHAYDYETSVPARQRTRHYGNHCAKSFSYAFGAGLDLDLTNKLRLGLGYRYANYGVVKSGQARAAGQRVAGNLIRDNFFTNQLLAQITWLFM